MSHYFQTVVSLMGAGWIGLGCVSMALGQSTSPLSPTPLEKIQPSFAARFEQVAGVDCGNRMLADDELAEEELPAWLTQWLRSVPGKSAATATAPIATPRVASTIIENDCASLLATETATPATATEKYCRQMARLLSMSLTASDQKESARIVDARQQAIEAAMLLVAENCNTQAELKMAELKSAHQIELAELRKQLAAQQSNVLAVGKSAVVNEAEERRMAQLQQWMSAWSANQFQSDQRLGQMAEHQHALSRRLDWLMAQFESRPVTPPQVIQNPLFTQSIPQVGQPLIATAERAEEEFKNQKAQVVNRFIELASKSELESNSKTGYNSAPERDLEQELQQQISKMQLRLNELRQQKVRRAGHLEPLYSPDKPLVPSHQR